MPQDRLEIDSISTSSKIILLVAAGLVMLSAGFDCFSTLRGWQDSGSIPNANSHFQIVSLLNSSTLNEIEDSIEDRSEIRRFVRPIVRTHLTRCWGVGTDQVLKGENHWLNYYPDMMHLLGRPFLSSQSDPNTSRVRPPDPIAAICHFDQALAQRGIQLIVVPVPSKAAIYPGRCFYPSRELAHPLENSSMQRFFDQLKSKGVRFVDLRNEFWQAKNESSPLFLSTDTHWSPHGVQLAAQLLSHAVDSNPSNWNDRAMRFERVPVEVNHYGDLAQMLGIETNELVSMAETTTIQQVVDGDDLVWQANRRAEVLLIGDSYSNIYSWSQMGWGAGAGLAEQLSLELGKGIDRIVQNGDGAFRSRELFAQQLRERPERFENTQTVIFQFAERELSDGAWKEVDLGFPRRFEPDRAELIR